MKSVPKPQLVLFLFLISILFTNCKKYVADSQQESEVLTSSNSIDVSKNVIPRVTGTYNVVGTRKDYTGKLEDSLLYNVYDLSLWSPKTITNSHDTLFCSYAIMSDAWQYVITFDNKTKEMKVEPSQEMLNSIVPGSWIVYDKYYHPRTKEFYFKTSYAVISSGNSRLVEETLTKQ